MKKLLILSLLALTASFAYAGSCGDGCGSDKKGEKPGVATTSMTIACDKTCDGEKKEGAGKVGMTDAATTLACDKTCDGEKKEKADKAGMTEATMTLACDKTCDGDKKGDKTGFTESASSMV